MEKRTINKKSLKETEEALKAPFPKEAYEETNSGQYLLKAECIEERLDNVLGYCNYDLLITEPRLEYDIGSKKSGCLTASCKIVIKDDSGAEVCSKTGVGIAEAGRDIKASAQVCINDALMRCIGRIMSVNGLQAMQSGEKADSEPQGDCEAYVAAPYLLKITGKARVKENTGYFVPVEIKGGRKINMCIPFELTNNMTAIEQDALLNSLTPGLEMQVRALSDEIEDEQVLKYVSMDRKA